MFKKLLSWFRKPAMESAVGPKVKTFPYFHRHKDNSTQEIHWSHPPGFPYEVFGGPLNDVPDNAPTYKQKQVWVKEKSLLGYDLVEDDYTDRLYHVWKGS